MTLKVRFEEIPALLRKLNLTLKIYTYTIHNSFYIRRNLTKDLTKRSKILSKDSN